MGLASAKALDQALQEALDWYPEDIWLPPRSEVPLDHLIVDAQAAAWMRNILNRVRERAREIDEESAG